MYAELEPKRAISKVFDFDELDSRRREVSTRRAVKDLFATMAAHPGVPLEASKRREIEAALANSAKHERRELEDALEATEREARELYEVWEGTVGFLQSEGYIREERSLFQLTEKGFSHLRMRFTETTLQPVDLTFAGKIREQLTNPSTMGAQAMLQVLSALISRGG